MYEGVGRLLYSVVNVLIHASIETRHSGLVGVTPYSTRTPDGLPFYSSAHLTHAKAEKVKPPRNITTNPSAPAFSKFAAAK